MRTSTDRFTFSGSTNTFITEASDLTRGNFLHQIWPDSCDEGLVLISEKTGQESLWYKDHDEYSDDEDHELLATHLLPTDCSIRKHPRLKNTKMVIIND